MTMNRKTERIADLFTIQVKFMMCTGQMPLAVRQVITAYTGLPRLASVLAYAISTFAAFQSLHVAALYIKTTYDRLMDDSELELITNAMAQTIIYSFSAFAGVYWWCLSPRLYAFMQRINSGYREHSLPAATYVDMREAYERARLYTIIWQGLCFAGVLLYAIAPLIIGMHVLPLNMWYPFEVLEPSSRYALIYMLQVHAQVNMGNTFGTSSAVLCSMTIILLAQYDSLFCSLKNLYSHALLRCGRPDNEDYMEKVSADQEELNQYLFSTERRTDSECLERLRFKYASAAIVPNLKEALHESLVECIRLHIFLVESCIELEALFHPLCLVKSIQITLQLCLLVFVAVEGTFSIVNTMNLVQYVSLTFMELVMFTYCGELLRYHSTRSAEAFGRSPWWLYAPLIRRDLLIFLINSRRPVTLTAGKFYRMDVERLRLVLTQAISFLTLLQKLAAKRT